MSRSLQGMSNPPHENGQPIFIAGIEIPLADQSPLVSLFIALIATQDLVRITERASDLVGLGWSRCGPREQLFGLPNSWDRGERPNHRRTKQVRNTT